MMANLLFSLFSAVLGAILVAVSWSSVGSEQFFELVGATIAFGIAAVCLILSVRAAAAALRWRWHRAQLRHETRRAAYR
jgi:hypothetical protein